MQADHPISQHKYDPRQVQPERQFPQHPAGLIQRQMPPRPAALGQRRLDSPSSHSAADPKTAQQRHSATASSCTSSLAKRSRLGAYFQIRIIFLTGKGA
jgi:hypothetical protein